MNTSVQMIAVESSNVKALGYDPDNRNAYAEFTKSGLYCYKEVPQTVFDDWLASESKGKYFHKHIKEKYEYEKIPDLERESNGLSQDEVQALTECSVLIAGMPPQQGTQHAAGYDLQAAEEVELPPGYTKIVSTGIAIAMPENMAALVVPRSGLSAKTGLRVANAPGLIDADYRGTIGVVMHNAGSKSEFIAKGERIAQLMFIRVEHPDFVPVFELPTSDRGSGGFGSTGK